MAPLPDELGVTTRIDLTCPECQHSGALLTTTFEMLGLAAPEGIPVPVVNLNAASADVEARCEGCGRTVKWARCELSHNLPAGTLFVPEPRG